MKKYISSSAFSITELLIVVTILAILSGIGIISYGNYTSSTRDSKHVYDINQILSSLNQYKVRETLDAPSQHISYTQSGAIFAIQGQLDQTYLSKISFFGDVDDKSLNILPSLFLTFPRQDFQIMTFFENAKQDYSASQYLNHKKFPGVFGSQLGILLDTTTNLPLETSFTSGDIFDVAIPLSRMSRSYITHGEYVETQNISFLPNLASNSGKGWNLQGNTFICEGDLCIND